jgi:uncharacterized PurR-regulated membrane protein YhhQ (DUF165 family)
MRIGEVWKRRAYQAGLIASVVALVLWPIHAAVAQNQLRLAFVVTLAIVAASGLTILVIGISDLLTVSRGRRVLPARIFDVALGLILAGPAGLGLADLIG